MKNEYILKHLYSLNRKGNYFLTLRNIQDLRDYVYETLSSQVQGVTKGLEIKFDFSNKKTIVIIEKLSKY